MFGLSSRFLWMSSLSDVGRVILSSGSGEGFNYALRME
jgi:hypothetical protein